MSRPAVDNIRNVALVGHGGLGKTTLADLMLFRAGKNSRAGSVDDGTSLLDSEPDEHERKHSITSALCHFNVDDVHINLIDTPGMPDFAGHAIAPMQAVETALIAVGATGGLPVNSRKMFRQAENYGLARMIVITRCDADNIEFEELIEVLRPTFGPACALMNVPIGLGADFRGVVSTINPPGDIPEGCPIDPREAGQQVIDAAVEADEQLMERYLEGDTLSPDELQGAITRAIAQGTLIPVFCTSARADHGVQELMEGIARLAPSPRTLRHTAMRAGDQVTLDPDPDGPVIAQVFKTRIDPFVAKMNYLRIYSGTIKKDASLKVARSGKSIKISQLLEIQGAQHESINEAGPGEIVALVKIDDLHTGDTLSTDSDVTIPPVAFPKPMISLAVEPATQADQAKISTALQKIEEEDPCFYVHREEATHEMVMHGMSELHLQLIKDRLHAREKVDIITHQPKIPYRETVNGEAEGSYRHKKQSGGSGQFAEVHLRVSSCPQGVNPEEYFTKERFANMREFHYDPELNYAFVDRVTGGSVPNQFIPAVEKGIRERMQRGCIAGYQIQDIVVELYFGKDHPVDSNETAFKTASSMCLKKIFNEARPTLLEPIVHMEITVPNDKIGDITSDLNTRRGRMEGLDEAPGGFTTIKASAPLAEVMTYARSLSSLTAGQGSFTMEFSHYEMVPPNEQQKIIAAAKLEEEEA